MPSRNYEPEEVQTENRTLNNTEPEPQPVREITQTDRLNKRLLQSFLERINQNATHFQQNTAENSNNDTNEHDFD